MPPPTPKGCDPMAEKFVERKKLSKKARRALDNEGRATWTFSPVTRRVESRKHYNRKRDRIPGPLCRSRDFLYPAAAGTEIN